jgi:hypothetical protein
MGRTEKLLGIAGLLVAVGGLIFAGLQYSLQLHQQASPSRPTQTPDVVPQQKLAELFAITDIIGKDIDFVENVTGPASSTYNYGGSEHRSYKLDDCDVDIGLHTGQVESIRLDVTPSCSFSWRTIMPNLVDLPPPNRVRFQDVFDSGRDFAFIPGCLSDCGNAADPEHTLMIGGTHSDGWLVAVLVASENNPETETAARNLRAQLTSDLGYDRVQYNQFCGYDLSAVAKATTGTMRVTSVEIRPYDVGYDPPIGGIAACPTATP